MTPACRAAAAGLLRMKVFGCEECTDIVAFRRPPHGGPFYKFPPILGAQGTAPLLFIGINPRRTDTNRDLHEWLAGSPDNFERLAAKNRDEKDEAYIARAGPEPHYHCHAIVVEEVFGHGTLFESKAAVTELFLCASKSAPVTYDRLKSERSPCADRYLSEVMELVQPEVIVSVGSTVKGHLSRYFTKMINVPVVYMKHPAGLNRMSHSEKVLELQPTINAIKEVCKSSSGAVTRRG